MVFKIRTSKKTMAIFEEMAASTNYAPFILSKLAISLSIKSGTPLHESDFKTDTFGLELNRQTITGDADTVYKCLMELYANTHLTDDEFFPGHVKAHIDRGAPLLEQEARYGNDLLIHLTELDKGI